MTLKDGFEWGCCQQAGTLTAWVSPEKLATLPPPDWSMEVGKGGNFLIEYHDSPQNRVALLIAGHRVPGEAP